MSNKAELYEMMQSNPENMEQARDLIKKLRIEVASRPKAILLKHECEAEPITVRKLPYRIPRDEGWMIELTTDQGAWVFRTAVMVETPDEMMSYDTVRDENGNVAVVGREIEEKEDFREKK